MINTLLIKNFALIKSLEVDFEKGFTVVSGETGSGKSIMLDAISLLMGKRSDRGSLYDKEKKCILEIEIELSDDKEIYFQKNNLDFDNKTIIRREISYSGKSRSFINDIPVSLSMLNDVVSSTIEIYSQNQSISLKSEEKQLELLDNIANSEGLIQNYKVVYNKYNKLKNEIENIKKGNKLSDAELEFLNFQIEELFQSKLKEGEKEELESQFIVLENSSNIIEKLSKSFQLLSEENGVNTKVSQIENELQKLSDLSERLNDLVDRVSSVRIELSDIESEMNILSESVDNNPESLMIVSNRLDHLNSLLVKHRKSTVYELILLLEEMNLKVQSSSDFEKIIIAYEPVWAIGTGLTAEPSDAQAMHSYIRNAIANKFTTKTSEQISILYGGSCKPANSKELFSMKDIDGGLIGGASLDSNSFLAIVNSF